MRLLLAVSLLTLAAAQDFSQGVDLVQRIDEAYPWLSVLGFDVDAQGNLCLAGIAVAAKVPATVNLRFGPLGGDDMVVLKLDPFGRQIYGTTVGGSQGEYVTGVKADPAGNVYLFGSTASPDYPAMSSQPSSNAAVALKLDPAGNILYDTRLDWTSAILTTGLDSAGNLYIGGNPQLGTMPVSPEAYRQASPGSGGFIAKLDRLGALTRATYIEGLQGEGPNLAVRANGDVLFSMGKTIAALDSSLSQLRFSTLTDIYNITHVGLDSSNNIYAAAPDAVRKYAPDGVRLLWRRDFTTASFPQFAVTASGTAFLFGKAPPNYPTYNGTQPCGLNLVSPVLNVPVTNLGFLMVIDPDDQLLYATFMAGDFGMSISAGDADPMRPGGLGDPTLTGQVL